MFYAAAALGLAGLAGLALWTLLQNPPPIPGPRPYDPEGPP